MGWIAVNKRGEIYIHEKKPTRGDGFWLCHVGSETTTLNRIAMRILLGRELTFEDEPVEIKKNDNENIVFRGNGDSTKDVAIAFRQLCEDISNFGEMKQSYWNVSLRGNKKTLRSRAKQIVMRAKILQEIINSYTEE